MDRSVTVAEQKLAEKLAILNRRGRGMLTRIYNIKKACSDPKSRPTFLGEKSLEPAIKAILKKFPNIESARLNAPHMSAVLQMHTEIVKGLTNYYYTFIDVMDFKDHVGELLTSIDANFVYFDITLNFDLTKAYLDLIVTYLTLFLLISRVEDRKVVLSLFNHAYEVQKGHGESGFPRLGLMILDYENPLKKLTEEFTTHAQRVGIALQSLHAVYQRRNEPGDRMRQAQLLSLTSMPQGMLNPAQRDMVQCEYLSLETITNWILLCYMLCPSQLSAQPGALEIWKLALQDGYCIRLFRDEIMMVHKDFSLALDSMKGYSKRKKDVEESLNQAITTSAPFHRERRRYLRMAIEELNEILGDQPGLLGPKALIGLIALSLGRDEVNWLLRHNHYPPPKGKKVNQDDFSDSQLPRLLHSIVGLRELFFRYSKVIQRYFAQYLSGFDVAMLKGVIQKISVCSEDDSLIMTSFVETLSTIDVNQATSEESVDLRGIRLDWMRLQAYTSVRGSVPELKDTRDLATLMNTIVLHTQLVDNQTELLNEVSDLSLFCFYPSVFEKTFLSCLENPRQMRFSVAYPMVCMHFLNCSDSLCPEERHPIGDRSLSAVNSFLDAMAIKGTHFVSLLCEDHLQLAKQLWAGHAVTAFTVDDTVKNKKERPRPPMRKPGEESRKKTVEDVTQMENKHQGQSDLLIAITHTKDITVWDHVFSPKEYLVSHLEEYFAKTVTKLANYKEVTNEISRPTRLLRDVKAYMTTLYRVEESVSLDMGRIFNSTLLQQTQSTDNTGGPTLTSTYTTWYIDVFLKQVTDGNPACIFYSPARKSFISKSRSTIKAENYTDAQEMRALAELLGAYGIKYFCRKMMSQIASQVEELKKMVLINKEALVMLKDNFNDPSLCADYVRRLQAVNGFWVRMTIIGMILSFRSLLLQGLQDVLEKRVPFLLKVLTDFKENNPRDDLTLTHEMAQAAGVESEFDADLFHALRSSRDKNEEDSGIWELLLVFLATVIPMYPFKDSPGYNPIFQAFENNAHCIAIAVNSLSQALFTITDMDPKEKMKDFLAIASCNLLRLAIDPPAKESNPKQKESVYILLDLIVQESPFLTADEVDSCLPYSLMREAYQVIFKKHRVYTGQFSNTKTDQEQN